ncbi:MAG: alanine racemase [Holosporales bacterium]|nr:alanine racemase [Holosporales bacterium]
MGFNKSFSDTGGYTDQCSIYTWAEIDAYKIKRNYRIFRQHVSPTICAAVLKADAYRMGACEVGEVLFQAGCRHFFVAYVDEADALAKHLLEHCCAVPSYDNITEFSTDNRPVAKVSNFEEFLGAHEAQNRSVRDDSSIGATLKLPKERSFRNRSNDSACTSAPLQKYKLFVLDGPFIGAWCLKMASAGYTPVLNTIENVCEWNGYAAATNNRLPAILHIDTGLRRLGIPYSDINAFERIDASWIEWEFFMSHFVASSDVNHAANAIQISRVANIREKFPDIPFSLADTDGVLLGRHVFFDMVRVGVGLYGFEEYLPGVECCITVYGKILQIQDIAPGTGVGYNWHFVSDKNMRIATVSCGYADGVTPSLLATQNIPGGSGGIGPVDCFIINGQEAPIIWRNSMDLTTVDITNIDAVRVGDEAVILGHPIQLKNAQAAGIAFHRRLVSLSSRVRRIFVNGAPHG